MKSKYVIGLTLLLIIVLFGFTLGHLGVLTLPNNNVEDNNEITEGQDDLEFQPKLYNSNSDEDLDEDLEEELNGFKETIER
ncbi:hypothetical protein MWH25_12635 [Natroniella acetigena]|uniref:hypothetical protein n=1 Tax=Natroniella acetigena TaxID=52004 RepID=UPI00200B69AA|nr:hypothetical protein [Natroniella acetigena]MCK8828570.1 hypothetical protein [Natroniella acetigena]